MLKAYKYCLLPTEQQKQQLAGFFGSCRFVFNLALETKIQAYKKSGKNLSCFDLHKQLKDLKDHEAEWLKDCPAQSLQSAIRNLDTAYSKFFKGAGFPKFKSRHHRQSIQFPQGVSVDFDKGTVRLPKLDKVNCIFHRRFDGTIKTVTVSRTPTGKFFISILVENQDPIPAKRPVCFQTSVGIDMGVKTFATLSDGSSFENPRHLRGKLARLRVEQRKLNRRFRKGAKEQSKSYQKQKLVVAKLHEHIKNQREDYLHKASTKIIRSFDTICLEDLNIKGMMQNQKLSLAIGELGWHRFKTMLEYKGQWHGKNIVFIDRFAPSSRQCHQCGTVFREMTLSDRHWICAGCGADHDRDLNAALNIKTFGLRNQPATVNVSC